MHLISPKSFHSIETPAPYSQTIEISFVVLISEREMVKKRSKNDLKVTPGQKIVIRNVSKL